MLVLLIGRTYSITMQGILTNIVLTFLLFASQILDVFGRLTVIRDLRKENEIKLTCLSEDDGGALVWNDVISKKSMERLRKIQFYNVDEAVKKNKQIDCKMNKIDNCWKSWTTEEWSLTDSLTTPLGPVFDQRWEEFAGNGIYDYLKHPVEIKNATVFSLSVRVAAGMTIILCNGFNYKQNFSYSIRIGDWSNTRSVIQKCPNGIPTEWQYSDEKCKDFKDSHNHKPLSSTEWRTFLIKWNSVTRNISVYDAASNTVFMKYQDNEESTSSNKYYMFFSCKHPMLYRFHIYTFLHTTNENAILRSPIFQFNNKIICIQLLVGLCAECNINIILYDAISNKELKKLTVKSSSKIATHGLPTWQFVTIEHSTDANSAMMELRPVLNSYSPNPLWAVANVRQCPRNESFRKSILDVSINPYAIPSPNVTCQKLFYNNHTIVSSLSTIEPNMKLDNGECPKDKFGPRCMISCNQTSYPDNNCKSSVICYQNGCTCFPGFMGRLCSRPCQRNTYGQNCKYTCDSCMNIKQSQFQCNKITGACNHGCRTHPDKLFIPPMCQISITKPIAPLIMFQNPTNIQAKLPLTWKKEYDGLLFYSFIIQTTRNININGIQSWKPVFNNATELTDVIKNLNSNVIYYIACILRACDRRGELCNNISSEWHTVQTTCNRSDFLLKLQANSLSINWKNDQQYSCPVSHTLIIQRADTRKEILRRTIDKFPYEVLLLPNTSFNVTILYKNQQVFSKQIRTLKEAPMKTLNPQCLNVSDTNATLSWTASNQVNEEILEYRVTLQIKKYHGCKDSKSIPSDFNITRVTNDKTITFSNLHPYASYSAEVVAYTSQYMSKPEEITFDTNESAIASEEFRNINVQGWNMTWQPPKDCRTITGRLHAKIEIQGASDNVNDINIVKNTAYSYLLLNKMQLYGAERYVATLYVVRHAAGLENQSAYQEYEFETPPKAPPKVTHLEVYELDSRQAPAIVHLRWQHPHPPLNGRLYTYRIQSCGKNNNCTITEVKSNAVCTLWDNYICGSTVQRSPDAQQTIEVVGYNMNVAEPGIPAVLSQKTFDNMLPDPPDKFNATTLNNSIVDLQWSHPWKTGTPLAHFLIRVDLNDTNLEKDKLSINQNQKQIKIKFMVSNYKRIYSERIHLFPSSQYIASIRAVTHTGEFSDIRYKNFETPSTITFNGHLTYMLSDSMIVLNIPPVLNNTKNSMIHVIVKGSTPCKGYSKVPENLQTQAGLKMNDDAWQAAELSTQMFGGKSFIVGNNEVYGKAKNCPLQPEKLYDIIVIAESNQSLYSKSTILKISIRNKHSSKHHERWIVPLILIVIGAAAGFYFYRRKKQEIIKQELQNETTLSQDVRYKETQAQDEAHDDIKLETKSPDSSQQ